ncbi:MAG: cytochrome c oxidase assembly protein, partial [Armatimonadetes bacterium]|nr:cytochrome c oxidase assembly protein [Anaerolineae bacterium]
RGVATFRVSAWRIGAFAAGMVTLFIALISPLDALSATLFAGHMVQHLLLVLIAAPLLAFSRPMAALLRGLPWGWRKAVGRVAHAPVVRGGWETLIHPVTATLLHIAVMWVWHIPGFYRAALTYPALHALQHASFFGTALLFWWMILRTQNYGGRVLSVFGVMMTTGLLGALMTFATTPWYEAHTAFVSAWGLTVLEDQQLAGLFMWIPAGFAYIATAAWLLGAWLNAVEQQMTAHERQLAKDMRDA